MDVLVTTVAVVPYTGCATRICWYRRRWRRRRKHMMQHVRQTKNITQINQNPVKDRTLLIKGGLQKMTHEREKYRRHAAYKFKL